MQPPVTVSEAPKDPEDRLPPLEEAPVCMKALHGLVLEECRGISLRTETGCLPPNYLNNDCKNATSPKSTIKEEPKTGKQDNMWMGTRLPLLQRSGKAGLGWQTPKPAPKGSTPTRSTETTSQMTAKHELSKAPKHTEIYPGGVAW